MVIHLNESSHLTDSVIRMLRHRVNKNYGSIEHLSTVARVMHVDGMNLDDCDDHDCDDGDDVAGNEVVFFAVKMLKSFNAYYKTFGFIRLLK